MAIWLDLSTVTFWETGDFPLDPQKVKLVYEGVNSNRETACVQVLNPTEGPIFTADFRDSPNAVADVDNEPVEGHAFLGV